MTSNEISTTTTMTTRLKRKKTAQQLLPSPMNQITDTTLNVHQKIDLCLTNEPRSIAFFVTSVPTTIEWNWSIVETNQLNCESYELKIEFETIGTHEAKPIFDTNTTNEELFNNKYTTNTLGVVLFHWKAIAKHIVNDQQNPSLIHVNASVVLSTNNQKQFSSNSYINDEFSSDMLYQFQTYDTFFQLFSSYAVSNIYCQTYLLQFQHKQFLDSLYAVYDLFFLHNSEAPFDFKQFADCFNCSIPSENPISIEPLLNVDATIRSHTSQSITITNIYCEMTCAILLSGLKRILMAPYYLKNHQNWKNAIQQLGIESDRQYERLNQHIEFIHKTSSLYYYQLVNTLIHGRVIGYRLSLSFVASFIENLDNYMDKKQNKDIIQSLPTSLFIKHMKLYEKMNYNKFFTVCIQDFLSKNNNNVQNEQKTDSNVEVEKRKSSKLKKRKIDIENLPNADEHNEIEVEVDNLIQNQSIVTANETEINETDEENKENEETTLIVPAHMNDYQQYLSEKICNVATHALKIQDCEHRIMWTQMSEDDDSSIDVRCLNDKYILNIRLLDKEYIHRVHVKECVVESTTCECIYSFVITKLYEQMSNSVTDHKSAPSIHTWVSRLSSLILNNYCYIVPSTSAVNGKEEQQPQKLTSNQNKISEHLQHLNELMITHEQNIKKSMTEIMEQVKYEKQQESTQIIQLQKRLKQLENHIDRASKYLQPEFSSCNNENVTIKIEQINQEDHISIDWCTYNGLRMSKSVFDQYQSKLTSMGPNIKTKIFIPENVSIYRKRKPNLILKVSNYIKNLMQNSCVTELSKKAKVEVCDLPNDYFIDSMRGEGNRGLKATDHIEKFTVIQMYGGTLMSEHEYDLLINSSEYAEKVVQYTFSFTRSQENEMDPKKRLVICGNMDKGHDMISGSENFVKFVNDPRQNINVPETGNCSFIECSVNDFPCIFLVTLKTIKKGEWLLASYGETFFQSIEKEKLCTDMENRRLKNRVELFKSIINPFEI